MARTVSIPPWTKVENDGVSQLHDTAMSTVYISIFWLQEKFYTRTTASIVIFYCLDCFLVQTCGR
jgi:hypothetical protein